MDLGGATRRRYGGCGFALDAFHTSVAASPSVKNSVLGAEACLNTRARGELAAALARLQSEYKLPPIDVHIQSMPPAHVGLGSKTSLLLGVLKAASAANGLKLPARDLMRLSARGGTSGVGVHSFFEGGFIVDSGHPAPREGAPYLPSSLQTQPGLPALSIAKRVPSSWRFHLILPCGGRVYTQDEERLLFSNSTPLPRNEVLESLAAVYHGVVPAVERDDLFLMAESLADMHRFGFKSRELSMQPACRDLYSKIRVGTKLSVGLSSMGPILYVVTRRDDEDSAAQLRALCKIEKADYLGCFSAAGTGHKVIADATSPVS